MTVKTAYWKSQELVMIGVFAAAIKLSSLLIALAGGGMNPVTLMLKNLVFTTLLIVLLAKVKKKRHVVAVHSRVNDRQCSFNGRKHHSFTGSSCRCYCC